MRHTTVASVEAVDELAAGLFDPARDRPWLVITTRFASPIADIDVEALLSEVGDVARIHLIETGDLTRHLSALLPEYLDVYGGAGRSYPVGFGAHTARTESPLRFPQPNGRRATDRLITDALGHAQAAGLFDTAPEMARVVSGTVKGFTAGGSRALVMLDDGTLATVWQELTYPPIPLDWTLRAGQSITGLLDLQTRRLNVAIEIPDAVALEAAFPHREVTLALVQAVSETHASLALHPGAAIQIALSDVSLNPRDRLDMLLSEGDVVAARVLHLQGGRLHMVLSDVDDGEVLVPSLSLVADGPPWLRADRPLMPPVEDLLPLVEPLSPVELVETPLPLVEQLPLVEPVETPQAPRPRPGLQPARPAAPAPIPAAPRPEPARHSVVPAELVAPTALASAAPALQATLLSNEALKHRVASLEAELADAGASTGAIALLRYRVDTAESRAREALSELGEARAKLRALEADRREQTRLLRDSRKQKPGVEVHAGPASRRDSWLQIADWARHEIYLAWVERMPAVDRARWPLPANYLIGPAFAESLDGLDAGQLLKALKTVVDVLTGRVRELPGRAVHPLRSSDAGGAPDRVRDDGARCMRAYVEQNAPAARRLHYWVLPDGTIELSRIVTHDDVEP